MQKILVIRLYFLLDALHVSECVLVHLQEQLLWAVYGIWYKPVPYVWLLCGYSHTTARRMNTIQYTWICSGLCPLQFSLWDMGRPPILSRPRLYFWVAINCPLAKGVDVRWWLRGQQQMHISLPASSPVWWVLQVIVHCRAGNKHPYRRQTGRTWDAIMSVTTGNCSKCILNRNRESRLGFPSCLSATTAKRSVCNVCRAVATPAFTG